MEKRKVTIRIGGQLCSFYSDDPEEYITALEQRANAILKQTARFSGPSAGMNAILAVVSLTDALMRTERNAESAEEPKEKKKTGKNAAKAVDETGQVSVWDLLKSNYEAL